MDGPLLAFNVGEVSLLDINSLIDKDRRFTLVDDESESDDLEEYLKQ